MINGKHSVPSQKERISWTNRGYAAFIAIAFVVLLIPLVCMSFATTNSSAENTEQAEWPALIVNSSLNVDYLEQLGDYFEDHYAFRNQLITIDAKLRTALFGQSNIEKVIVGSNGWLYYNGTIDDYMGTNLLTERELDNIAFDLSLAQSYAQAQGASFLFTLAPNKNSLYDENMPDRYLATTESRNAERLIPYLKKYGINYVNLFDALSQAEEQGIASSVQGDSGSDETLYYQKDTHWNSLGAAVAYEAIMRASGKSYTTYQGNDFTWRDGYVGDIDEMLYPSDPYTEVVPVLDSTSTYFMVEGIDVEDAWIRTTNSSEAASDNGTLLMYRDSFGNNLIPYFAQDFSKAIFSKYVPYDFTRISSTGANLVVVERAERNLYEIDSTGMVLPAPTTTLGTVVKGQRDGATIYVGTDGSFTTISGVVTNTNIDDDSPIFLSLTGSNTTTTYVALRTTENASDNGDVAEEETSSENDTAASAVGGVVSTSSSQQTKANPYGYRVYIASSNLAKGTYQASIIVKCDGVLTTVLQTTITVR